MKRPGPLTLFGIVLAVLLPAPALAALPDITPVGAVNRVSSTTIDGELVLPPIAADRYYSIQFWPSGGESEKRPGVISTIDLPRGVSRLSTTKYFAPASKYRWVILLKAADEAQTVIAMSRAVGTLDIAPISERKGPTPSRIEITGNGELRTPAGEYVLQWKPVPGARKYIVATCATDKPWTKPDGRVDACAEEDAGQASYDPTLVEPARPGPAPTIHVKIDKGKHFAWYVKAIDDGKTPIGYSPERTIDVSPAWSSSLKEAGFSLSGTLDPTTVQEAKDNYATFGYSRGNDKDGDYRFYHAKFALAWKGKDVINSRGDSASLAASLESSLASRGKARGDDKIDLRLGATEYWGSNPELGARFGTNAKYETNRSTSEAPRTEKTSLEISMAPVFGKHPLVWNIPAVNDSAGFYTGSLTQVTISPTIAFDRGRTTTVGASEETNPNLLRYWGKLRIDLSSSLVAMAAGNASLFVERTWYYMPWEEFVRTPAQTSSGIDFPLATDVALSLRYGFGRGAPLFVPSRSFDLGLGVKF